MARRPAPIIAVLAPGQRALQRVLDRTPFVVGRDEHADCILDFPWVSRRHLVFEQLEAGWCVRSESKNEVLCDGEVLAKRRLLDPGARLDVGPIAVLFDPSRARVDLDEGDIGAVSFEVSIGDLRDRGGPAPARHLALLGLVSEQLQGATSKEEVARCAADALLQAVRARSAVLLEMSDAGGGAPAVRVLGARGARLARVSRGLVDRVLAARSTVSVADAGRAPDLAGRTSIDLARVGPILAAPLGGEARGVLYADREADSVAFDESDATFATVLAQLTGPALEAARRTAEALEARDRLEDQQRELLRDIERRGAFGGLVGTSAPMRKLASTIGKVAPTDTTVLIGGETGSGKELVAREIHLRSSRASAPFFAVNCAALPETLIESELFGHRRGAFTGADKDRRGIFELAQGGTVFLDEIGELPSAAQAKVLRVLEVREVLPIGAEESVPVSVRLVAATHRDLAKDVSAGRFRQDLFYRLNVFPISIPPLRERVEDVPALVAHFLAASPEARRKRVRPPSQRALEALSSYRYPGNVRELAHVIERAVILADDDQAIDLEHLPEEVVASPPSRAAVSPVPLAAALEAEPPRSLRGAVEAFERALILRELERDGWNRTKTARRLDISLRAFMEKLRRYGLKEPGRGEPGGADEER